MAYLDIEMPGELNIRRLIMTKLLAINHHPRTASR